jgi:rubredoxin
VSSVVYHPDPAINEEIAEAALESERLDLAAGYPPRRWTCPDCAASHSRGHFQVIGVHRCLSCGYVGSAGVMSTEDGSCG